LRGEGVLVCGPLDLDDLRRWAKRLEITEGLEAALREAGRL
jgi:hypothetical protein